MVFQGAIGKYNEKNVVLDLSSGWQKSLMDIQSLNNSYIHRVLRISHEEKNK